MYNTTIHDSNYGAATATYADYVAISNPDYIPHGYPFTSSCHTGSVDYFRYNKGGDIHVLINTLYRPLNDLGVLLTEETSSNSPFGIYPEDRMPLHTELTPAPNNTQDNDLAMDIGKISFDYENSFGKSLDLYNKNLIVGCPEYIQSFPIGNEVSIILSGSSAYIFNLGLIQLTSSYDTLIQSFSCPNNTTGSFGTSVSINSDWAAIGSPFENSNSGVVYLYQYQTGSNQWQYTQTLTVSSSVTSPEFGYSLKLNKDQETPSGRLVVGCGNPTSEQVYYFEESGSIWSQVSILTPTDEVYPLTFGDYVPYGIIRNTSTVTGSGFGNSVSLYGDNIIVGEYLDRTVYEYSGSLLYHQGSVSIFGRCSNSSSMFNLIYKTYGNENTIQDNMLGYSVDIFGDYAVAGIPKSNQYSLMSTYIQNTIEQAYQCEENILTSLNGQVALIIQSSGSWAVENVYQKKKKYLSPYRAFGNNVSVSDFSLVVGAPILMTDLNRNITLTTTQSQDIYLDDICGKSYIYNFHNLQPSFHIGNVFYRNGKIILMTSGSIFSDLLIEPNNINTYSYNLQFKGSSTIYEKQIVCNITPGEFNVSTNPTSLIQSTASFDLNGNGEFDYEDLEILLRYMQYKNTQATGESISTNWSSSVIVNSDEICLQNYYKSGSFYNESYISSQVLNYIPIWDFANTEMQLNLDFNGDSVIDIRDMNILWKYFSNRLTPKNYITFITANSSRQSFSQAMDFLNELSGKYIIPTILPNFSNYNLNIKQDPTGSYLAPVISSIGLYDDKLQLVAVAKLGVPIKNDGQLPLNVLIKIDF